MHQAPRGSGRFLDGTTEPLRNWRATRAGVPRLCPRLLALAEFHPRPRVYRRALLMAALAVAPRVVAVGHFRLFWLAWVQPVSMAQMLETLGESEFRARAIRERVRRASHCVEDELLQYIEGRDRAALAPGALPRDPVGAAERIATSLVDVARDLHVRAPATTPSVPEL